MSAAYGLPQVDAFAVPAQRHKEPARQDLANQVLAPGTTSPVQADLALDFNVNIPATVRDAWLEGRRNGQNGEDTRTGAEQRAGKGVRRALHAQHLAALSGLYLLARKPMDPRRSENGLVGRVFADPDYIADVCGGWQPDTLRALLTPTRDDDGNIVKHSLLSRWARLVASPPRREPEWEGDTGKRWVIEVDLVDVKSGEPYIRIPAWWLWEETLLTLHDGNTVQRRTRRALRRTTDGDWLVDRRMTVPSMRGRKRVGEPMPVLSDAWDKNDPALLGAFIVIERERHESGVTSRYSAKTLGARWGLGAATAHEVIAAAESRGYIASTRRTGGREQKAHRTVVRDPALPAGTPLSAAHDGRKVKPPADERGDFTDEPGGFRDKRGDFTDEPGDFADERGDVISTYSPIPTDCTSENLNADPSTPPGSASHVPGRFHDDGEEFVSNGDKQVPAPVFTSQSKDEDRSKGGFDKGTCAGADDLSLAGPVDGWTAQEQAVVDALATAGIDIGLTDENRAALTAVSAVGLDAEGTVQQMLAMLSREPSLRSLLTDSGVSHLLHDLVPTDWVSDTHRASGLRRGSAALDAWFDRQAS